MHFHYVPLLLASHALLAGTLTTLTAAQAGVFDQTHQFVYNPCTCDVSVFDCPQNGYQIWWADTGVCYNFLEPDVPKISFYMRLNPQYPVIDMNCTVFTQPDCQGETFTMGRATNATDQCWDSTVGGTVSAMCEWEQIGTRCETPQCRVNPNVDYCEGCQ